MGQTWARDDSGVPRYQRAIGRAVYGGRGFPLVGLLLVLAGIAGLVTSLVMFLRLHDVQACGASGRDACATTATRLVDSSLVFIVPAALCLLLIAIGSLLIRMHNRDWPPRPS